MVQLTLNTGTAPQEEKLLVPIFIYKTESEAVELAELIVKVKPTYLLNCSNSVESLKSYVDSGKVNNSICYILDSGAVEELEKDKKLLAKVNVIDFFN